MLEINDIVHPGWRICYKTSFQRKQFVLAWALYQGLSNVRTAILNSEIEGHRFDFWQEVFFEAIKQGREKLRTKTSLWCNSEFKPLYYEIFFQNGTSGKIEFENGQFHARLAEGTNLTQDYIPADFILGNNLLPQVAIKLRLLKNTSCGNYQSSFFSPDVLQTIPYGLSVGDGIISSNLKEFFTLDREGWVLKAETADSEVSIKRCSHSLPDWDFNESASPLRVARLYRPVLNYSGQIVDVEFPSRDVTIGGTLSYPPPAQKKLAASLLIGGSGRYDRHGFSGNLDLGYHEILDKIATAGIVGLRFDSRGAGSTRLGVNILEFGFEQLLEDTKYALNFLSRHPDVTNLPIFVIGHSLGGLIALNLAAENMPKIAGVILLATAARPLDQVLIEQTIAQARELDLSQQTLKQRVDDIKEFFYHLKYTPVWTPQTVPPKVYSQNYLRKLYAELLKQDPLDMIAQIKCPVFIVQGGKDVQVSVIDARLLHRVAEKRKQKVDLLILGDCDHFFKRTGRRSGLKVYYDSRRRVSSKLIKSLQKWILDHIA